MATSEELTARFETYRAGFPRRRKMETAAAVGGLALGTTVAATSGLLNGLLTGGIAELFIATAGPDRRNTSVASYRRKIWKEQRREELENLLTPIPSGKLLEYGLKRLDLERTRLNLEYNMAVHSGHDSSTTSTASRHNKINSILSMYEGTRNIYGRRLPPETVETIATSTLVRNLRGWMAQNLSVDEETYELLDEYLPLGTADRARSWQEYIAELLSDTERYDKISQAHHTVTHDSPSNKVLRQLIP